MIHSAVVEAYIWCFCRPKEVEVYEINLTVDDRREGKGFHLLNTFTEGLYINTNFKYFNT